MCAEVGGFEVGDGEQRADAGVRLAASDAGKAVVDEDAVVVVKRDEVGDGAEGDEVEVVGEAQLFRPAALCAQVLAQGEEEVEGDTDAGEVFAGEGAVAAVGVDGGDGVGQGVAGQVVVGDEGVDAAGARGGDGFVAAGAVIHGEDEAGRGRQSGKAGEAEAVAVRAAVRDEPVHVGAQLAQDAHGEGGGGGAIDVVVAIDEDGFVRAQRALKAVKRGGEVGEVVRRQQVLQAFFDFVVPGKAAGVDVFDQRVPVFRQGFGADARGAGGEHGCVFGVWLVWCCEGLHTPERSWCM